MTNIFTDELDVRFDREILRELLNTFRRVVVRENDKSLADRLEEQLLRRDPPYLDRNTFLRLAKWCKTDGIYSDGMVVAQKISNLLFNRVLDRNQFGV